MRAGTRRSAKGRQLRRGRPRVILALYGMVVVSNPYRRPERHRLGKRPRAAALFYLLLTDGISEAMNARRSVRRVAAGRPAETHGSPADEEASACCARSPRLSATRRSTT